MRVLSYIDLKTTSCRCRPLLTVHCKHNLWYLRYFLADCVFYSSYGSRMTCLLPRASCSPSFTFIHTSELSKILHPQINLYFRWEAARRPGNSFRAQNARCTVTMEYFCLDFHNKSALRFGSGHFVGGKKSLTPSCDLSTRRKDLLKIGRFFCPNLYKLIKMLSFSYLK